jgi:hypothetical protein
VVLDVEDLKQALICDHTYTSMNSNLRMLQTGSNFYIHKLQFKAANIDIY